MSYHIRGRGRVRGNNKGPLESDTNKNQTINCSDLGDNHDICKKCNNTVTDGAKALECENCINWWHAKCINMSDQEYKLAMKNKYLKFICPECENDFENSIFPTSKEELKSTSGQDSDIGVKKQLTELSELLMNVLERLTKIEKSGIGHTQNIDKKIEDLVDAKLQDAIEEQRVKESKKLNLIVVNMRENHRENPLEAKKEDKKAAEALIKEILPEENIEVNDPVRLRGVQIGSKPRLLRVSVSDEKTKWNIIKNAHRLNSSGKRNYKIYINPDQTLKEREEYRRLKDELNRRTAGGETHLKIERVGNRRQIVRREPEEVDSRVNSQGGN